MDLSSYDPTVKELLFRVYEAAWRELATSGRVAPSEPHETKPDFN